MTAIYKLTANFVYNDFVYNFVYNFPTLKLVW